MARKKTPPPRPAGPPRRPKGWKNTDVRPREHLTDEEVQEIRRAAGRIGRNKHRDATMILIAYRHGLRNSELVRWRWDRISFKKEEVWIERAKGSESGMHTLQPDEIKALERLPGEHKGWVFKTESGDDHISESAFHKIVARAARAAADANPALELDFLVHPHMLRHACGFVQHQKGKDIRDIQAWLGHKSIQNTVRYTKLDAEHFKRVRMW